MTLKKTQIQMQSRAYTHRKTHKHLRIYAHKHAHTSQAITYTNMPVYTQAQFICLKHSSGVPSWLMIERNTNTQEGQTRPNTEFDEWFIQGWGRPARWENFLMVSASSSLLSQLSSFAFFDLCYGLFRLSECIQNLLMKIRRTAQCGKVQSSIKCLSSIYRSL